MLLFKKMFFLPVTLIVCLIFIGCPEEQDVQIKDKKKQAYNIILVVDVSAKHYAELSRYERDQYIYKTCINWFKKRQDSLITDQGDKLKIIFLPSSSNAGPNRIYSIDLSGNTYSFDDRNKIINGYSKLLDSNKVSRKRDFICGEFWDFFKNELPSLIEKDTKDYNYANKMVLISDGKLFWCTSDCLKNITHKCIGPNQFASFSDKYEEEGPDSGMILMRTPDDTSYGNMSILFAEVNDFAIHGKSTINAQEYVLKEWFEKSGIECDIIKSPSCLQLYDKWIDDFLTSRSIKDRINIPIHYAGKGYSMSLLKSNELVDGLKGTYWKVNINDARTNKYVYFEPGRYDLDFSVIENSIAEFCENVVNVIASSTNNINDYRIFVKGSADQLGYKGFSGVLENNRQYKIKYLPIVKGQAYIYKKEESEKDVGPLYRNVDLPDLRAHFLKENFDKLCVLRKAQVLEGTVSSVESIKDRNVCLLLFISGELENK